MKVKMTWNEINQKWLMTIHGFFIFDFWNCKTTHSVFKGLDKKISKYFDIIVKQGDGT